MVDDDPLVARVLARVVERDAGLPVRSAQSTRDVIDVLRHAVPPSALLLDFDLGEAQPDGVDVLLALRHRGISAPAAFCSSAAPEVVHERLREVDLPPAPCFPKPVPRRDVAQWLSANVREGR